MLTGVRPLRLLGQGALSGGCRLPDTPFINQFFASALYPVT